jgi:hypothetical protein
MCCLGDTVQKSTRNLSADDAATALPHIAGVTAAGASPHGL